MRLVQLRVDGGTLPSGLPGQLLLHELPGVTAERIRHRELEHCHGGQRPHRVETIVIEDAAPGTRASSYGGGVTAPDAAKTASVWLPAAWLRQRRLAAPGHRRRRRDGASGRAQAETRFAGHDRPGYAHRAIMVLWATARWAGPSDRARQPGCAAAGRRRGGADGCRARCHWRRWTFSVRLRGGPSRPIEVGYRAFSRDANYAALGRIKETVAAGVRLRISPTRTGSEGMILLSGTVEGPIPRQGTIVDLLVHYRGRWEPFRTPRTNRRGRFRVLYQLRAALGISRSVPKCLAVDRVSRSAAARAGWRMSARAKRDLRVSTMLSRWTCIVAALAPLMLLSPSMARAETAITTQAVADDGAFLPYAPAPAQLAGLCLVDTGVNPNPDTEGVVVERTALDGGSGGDVSPTLHGTVLAMMAGAPANGWGMVGAAPHAIQIVSVRILESVRRRSRSLLCVGDHRMPRTAA